MDNGKVVGIISDRDISAHLSNLDSLDVAQVITAKLITTTPQTSIRDAARLLCELKVGAMLVIEEERLAGIISTSDLLEALVDLR
jgi:acetoin utilization protein AcuB